VDRYREAALLAGCSWPYRVAAHLLKKLSGAVRSSEEIRLLTNQGGKMRAKEQQQEAEQICAGLQEPARTAANPSAPPEQEPLLVGLDGGWIGTPGTTRRHGRQSGHPVFSSRRSAHERD